MDERFAGVFCDDGWMVLTLGFGILESRGWVSTLYFR